MHTSVKQNRATTTACNLRLSTAVLTSALTSITLLQAPAQAVDTSAPTILQWFDGSYKSMETRASDIFMAGYGNLWTPPPGRADSGNHSVGYDQYNRFDLGYARNHTL